ncbi:hypothetical protein H6F86_30725 [Phormidium sp. FACHB-592]|uniref:Uncharacterized protein n=1 Tax=Stenomitos frigidus AS-A4 TaxID=2933935 RepID=A0ABV0KJ11_9CYAN|nr:hypothetical protein [Phormidium sp. FACHB-592]MBD2078188.1 hypothetical protein [Phormidium sp. FACHB-592]
MQFYSIYLLEERIELYALEREQIAVNQKRRLISTQKGYQCAYEVAVALSQAKQVPLVDYAQLA